VTGKLSAKYAHEPTGFSFDKLALSKTGSPTCEFSLKNIAPGLKFTFKVRRLCRTKSFTP
jgi:hypothetical protein